MLTCSTRSSPYRSARIGRHILQLIESGVLKPGDRIPPPRRMSAKMRTSVTTVSRAYVELEGQGVIAGFLGTGKFDRHLRRLRAAVEKQMHAKRLAICSCFQPETKFTGPSGGLVLWVELPTGIVSQVFCFAARERGIGLVPGTIFSTRDKYLNFIRLTCTGVRSASIEGGIRSLVSWQGK